MDCARSAPSSASSMSMRSRRATSAGGVNMGEIVAAIGTCHTPYLFTNPPDENPEQLQQAATAMRELGKVLDETKPDVILFLGADHVETFSPTCIPTFCIIAGSRAVARFAGRE